MLFEPFKLKDTTFNRYKTIKTCKNNGVQHGKAKTKARGSRTYLLKTKALDTKWWRSY